MLSIFINLLLFVHVLVCLLIVGVVLMQRPKNEGLGAAFGAGTTDALFGAQTSNVLASITRWLTGIFFGLTLLLSALYARQGREKTGVEQRLQESAQPIAPSIPTIPNEPLKSPATELSPNLPPGGSIPVPAVPEVPVPQVPAETKPAPTPDVPKAEAPKAEAPKADVPKADVPKADVPKAEPTAPSAPAPVKPPEPEVTKPSAPPVSEAPKAELPKTEAPKPEQTPAPTAPPAPADDQSGAAK